MVDPKELLNIDAPDAFRLALEFSGKSEKEVAAEMGWSFTNCHRVFSQEDYYASFQNIPKFCEVVGNNIIVLWLMVNVDNDLSKPAHEKVDCQVLLKDLGELFKETGDVGKEGAEAIKDAKLEPHELRKVIKELTHVSDKVFKMIGKLRTAERCLTKMLKDQK